MNNPYGKLTFLFLHVFLGEISNLFFFPDLLANKYSHIILFKHYFFYYYFLLFIIIFFIFIIIMWPRNFGT